MKKKLERETTEEGSVEIILTQLSNKHISSKFRKKQIHHLSPMFRLLELRTELDFQEHSSVSKFLESEKVVRFVT